MYLFNIIIEFLDKKPYLGSVASFGGVITVNAFQANETIILPPYWIELFSQVGLLLGVLVGTTALIINIRNLLKTKSND